MERTDSRDKRESYLFEYLPSSILRELSLLTAKSPSLRGRIGEIRLRAGGVSSISASGKRIKLSSVLTYSDIAACVEKLTAGALYAHRDTLASGYISLSYGIRVGVAGLARYEGGVLFGVSRFSAIVFRVPTAASPFTAELYAAFLKMRSGMLIYSPPGGGKTTAIRSLVKRLSCGDGALNTVVVDERCEFFHDDFRGCCADILSGYKKAAGLEIALRTLSPDVIVLDEIGGEDEAAALVSYLNSGVPIVATAHAPSYESLLRRKSIEPFIKLSVFDCFAGISGQDLTLDFL